jgi:MFS-type transporter involved in bile tolerance (Atg22 family)
VESYVLHNPFVDDTLRLIQHNLVVLAYNLNVVILVLIVGESSIGAISAYHFITVLSSLLPCIIILFLHVLSTNHMCTQPCYFPLLLKPAAQKEKMDCNSSTRSSRLRVALVAVPMELWSLPLFHSIESHHSL